MGGLGQAEFSRNVVLPPGQNFHTDVQRMGHEHCLFFFGSRGIRAVRPTPCSSQVPPPPLKKQRQTIAGMWPQAEKAKSAEKGNHRSLPPEVPPLDLVAHVADVAVCANPNVEL